MQLRDQIICTEQKLSATEEQKNKLEDNLATNEAMLKTVEHRNAELHIELERAYQTSNKLQDNLTTLIANFESIQDQLNTKNKSSIKVNSIQKN